MGLLMCEQPTNTHEEELTELRAAYRDNRERSREVNEEWKHVSDEANPYLNKKPIVVY